MNPPPGPSDADVVAEFPNLERWTYVNHAAVSPWPTRTVRAIEAFARSNHLDGPRDFPDWVANEQALRERAARLLAARAGEISLVPNTTEGICIVANGLDWRAGDNLVTARGEFPSNRMAWAALAARGVNLREVDLHAAAAAEGTGPELALLDAMDERTRVLAVSSVQWTDGLRLDLGRLGKTCRDAGVLFFVDAIQQFGALRIDVRAEHIDCLAAGGHKWQMAPEGCGIFYCREAWRERIAPLKRGWRMLERPFAFDEPDRPVRAGGQRFEAGTPNTLGQFALNASLSLQEDWGQAWIEARVLANTQRLRGGVASLPGVELAGRPPPAPASGIVSVRPTKCSARTVVQRMAERRVVAVARGDLVRLSPHAYQDERVVERALEALEEAARP